jgi:hypothetical protein
MPKATPYTLHAKKEKKEYYKSSLELTSHGNFAWVPSKMRWACAWIAVPHHGSLSQWISGGVASKFTGEQSLGKKFGD